MELALSLGNRATENNNNNNNNNNSGSTVRPYCMGSSGVTVARSTAEKASEDQEKMIKDDDDHDHDDHQREDRKLEKVGSSSSSDPTADISPRQLDLLPFSPVPRPPCTQPPPSLRFPWLSDNLSSEPGSSDNGPGSSRLNRRIPTGTATAEEGDEQSSPNSGTSSFMEFSLCTNNSNGGVKRREKCNDDNTNTNNNNNNNDSSNNYVQRVIVGEQIERGATTSRGSDDDENGSTRKKLRLSKEQSAFLEESFKEHHTLNPKQKLALAKQLNLRPRQVEVWFQNRRARTKLKQTEVDCEYLKRCCETLTEENKRLQKELQELRALKTSQPFFMQLPATTLTMCPSCERVAPTSTSAPTNSAPVVASAAAKPAVVVATTSATTGMASPSVSNSAMTLSLGNKPKPMLPFSSAQAPKAAS